MKLTKSKLKQIIKEEINNILLNEDGNWCTRISDELYQKGKGYNIGNCPRLWKSQCVGQDASKTARDVYACASQMDPSQLAGIGLKKM